MAAQFPDLADFDEYLDPSFELPYKGKRYRVPAPDAMTGIYLQAVMDGAESLLVTQSIGAANKAVLSDEDERTAYQMALGSAHTEMLADGLPWPVLKRAGIAALLYWTRSPEAALASWTAQGKAPEAGPDQTNGDTSPTGPSTPVPA